MDGGGLWVTEQPMAMTAKCVTRRGAFVYVKVSGSAAQCFTRRGAFVYVKISGLAAQSLHVYVLACLSGAAAQLNTHMHLSGSAADVDLLVQVH